MIRRIHQPNKQVSQAPAAASWQQKNPTTAKEASRIEDLERRLDEKDTALHKIGKLKNELEQSLSDSKNRLSKVESQLKRKSEEVTELKSRLEEVPEPPSLPESLEVTQFTGANPNDSGSFAVELDTTDGPLVLEMKFDDIRKMFKVTKAAKKKEEEQETNEQ
jgi:predicted nuclease with TOPRIM domain